MNSSLSDTNAKILQIAAKARRHELNHAIYSAAQGRVIGGPFAGMLLPEHSSWLDGDISPKLLGVYEAELHCPLREAAARPYRCIVNVGCAEGYYAIGLARLMPTCTVYAFDTNAEAQQVCRNAAVRNGVGERVVVGGHCSVDMLDGIASSNSPLLLFLDCEGGEQELLNPDRAPALFGADFIAECHDFYDRTLTPTILRRFEASHRLTVVCEGPRDPNAIPMLKSLGSLDRWLAVCEFRPETMHWIVATRK